MGLIRENPVLDPLAVQHLATDYILVTSFSSIPYYSNVRLISKMYLAQNFHSITLDIHASTFNPCFVYFLWEQAWFGKQHKDAV